MGAAHARRICSPGLTFYHGTMTTAPKERPGQIVTAGSSPDFAGTRVSGIVTPDAGSWAAVPQMFRSDRELPAPWREMFGPLRHGLIDGLMVVAQHQMAAP